MGTRIFRDAALEAPATRPVKTYPFFKLDGSVDLLLILVLIAFIVYGLLMVYSASTDYSWWWYESAFSQFHRQITWMILGIIVAAVAAFVDYHNWHKICTHRVCEPLDGRAAALRLFHQLDDSRKSGLCAHFGCLECEAAVLVYGAGNHRASFCLFNRDFLILSMVNQIAYDWI